MKRFLAVVVFLVAGVGAMLIYTALARDREYARLIHDGDAAMAANQPLVAIEAFSGAIALKRDSMIGYLKRGEIYRTRGDWSPALRDLRMASELDPTAPRPLEGLGDVQFGMQRYGQAAERYAAYIRLDDQEPRVLYKLALARHAEGKPASAIPPLRQAVSQDDRFAEAYYLLGVCLREQGLAREARQAWERAIGIAPTLVAAREQLADSYRDAGNSRDEIDQLEALAALEPNNANRRLALGLAHARTRRRDLAVLTLRSAAERFPDQPQLYVALGRVWLEAAEQDNDRVALGKALEALQGSVVRAPSSEAFTLLGRALLLAGDIPSAERTLQQATTRFPIEPSAYAYLATAAARLGHPATAREARNRFEALTGEAPAAMVLPAVR